MSPGQSIIFAIIQDILSNYDLGELISYEQNERGYVNTSFTIETTKKGDQQRYFLRRYKSGIQEVEIEFEHSVISHLRDKNFNLIAKVYPTKQGSTYFKKYLDDDGEQPIFYAIFDFLEGEDKYTCVDPHCTLLEIKSSAAVLAKFHHAVIDLFPKGQRFEPGILELLPQIRKSVKNRDKKSKGKKFDEYLQENISLIMDSCETAEQYFTDQHTSDWPQYLIHCDFHPGNLKFQAEKVVALFDFDWSKIDLRCFDVALAIWYFFVNWKGDQDGILRLDESRVFLDNYQLKMQNLLESGPLIENELQDLPMMTNLGNLYVLNWAVNDYYSKDVDAEEYLIWLRHCVNFIRWFNDSGYEHMERAVTSD